MKTTRNLLVALVLTIPPLAIAQAAPPSEPAPAGENKPAPPRDAQRADARMQEKVKSHMVPILVGIDAAHGSAAALFQLASPAPTENKHVRRTADLAEEAVKLAHEEARDLGKLEGLYADARRQADALSKKLSQAKESVDRIQAQVTMIQGAFGNNDARVIQDDAKRLKMQLAEAKIAAKELAGRYNVPTRVDFTAQTPDEPVMP
jgi:hypothetical protein